MDIVENYNNTIIKSARNPLTSLLPTSLLPTFKPLISPPTASKKFNYYYTSTSLKRQANRITAQNIRYKIAFKLYILAILF